MRYQQTAGEIFRLYNLSAIFRELSARTAAARVLFPPSRLIRVKGGSWRLRANEYLKRDVSGYKCRMDWSVIRDKDF